MLAPTNPLPVAAVSPVATNLAPIDSEPTAAMPSVANSLIPTDPVPFAVSFQNVSPQCDSAPSCSKVISSNATNLERVSQFHSNPIPLQAAASTKNNVFWKGKIIHKKRKVPKDRLPSCISSSKYR